MNKTPAMAYKLNAALFGRRVSVKMMSAEFSAVLCGTQSCDLAFDRAHERS